MSFLDFTSNFSTRILECLDGFLNSTDPNEMADALDGLGSCNIHKLTSDFVGATDLKYEKEFIEKGGNESSPPLHSQPK